MGIQAEIQKLRPTALIDLIELDATAQGGEVFFFHAGTNELEGDIVWQGQTYVRLPIEMEGFQKNSSGTLPRPVVRISNVQGLIAAIARDYNDFLGARVTRRRTFARFLDAVNFENGNPTADPTAAFPDEVWYVDRKASENPLVIEFELASALDMMGVMLPRRQVIQNTCTWIYRDSNCNYTGAAVADALNNPTTVLANDKCSKTLTGCKMRFGTDRLPFGGFPGVGLVRG